jgi:predicted dinucleotide-binding enzyme
MNIAFLGYGQVGGALATRLQRLGHDVVLAANDPNSDTLQRLLSRSPGLRVAEPASAVRGSEIVFLATPFQTNAEVLAPLAADLAGKILVDCTNPVGPGLSHGLKSEVSGSERVQQLVPGANVVKAFTIYGFENFEDNAFPGSNVKPVMMYCGQEVGAKQKVGLLIQQMGWEPLDVGGLEQALHLEHMTLLWIRLVRMHGHSPHLVWAALTR